MNGSAAGLTAMESKSKGEELRDLRIEVETVDKALEIAEGLASKLQAQEFERLVEAGTPQREAALRKIAMLLTWLERARQALDEINLSTRANYPLPGDGWVLAGRLSDTSSQTYRFLEWAAREGYISEEEFAEEFKNAHRTAPMSPTQKFFDRMTLR